MRDHVFEAGSRVRVTSYCPFRGLRGTVQAVDTIAYLAEMHCFYLIRLEGVQIKEPVWFEHQEVELVAAERSDHFGTGEVKQVPDLASTRRMLAAERP